MRLIRVSQHNLLFPFRFKHARKQMSLESNRKSGSTFRKFNPGTAGASSDQLSTQSLGQMQADPNLFGSTRQIEPIKSEIASIGVVNDLGNDLNNSLPIVDRNLSTSTSSLNGNTQYSNTTRNHSYRSDRFTVLGGGNCLQPHNSLNQLRDFRQSNVGLISQQSNKVEQPSVSISGQSAGLMLQPSSSVAVQHSAPVSNTQPIPVIVQPKQQQFSSGQLKQLPSYTDRTAHRPSYAGQTAHGPSCAGQPVHRPSYVGQTAHRPSYTGQTAYRSSYAGQSAHRPSYAGQSAHLPSCAGQPAHVPSYAGQTAHRPSYAGQSAYLTRVMGPPNVMTGNPTAGLRFVAQLPLIYYNSRPDPMAYMHANNLQSQMNPQRPNQ